MMLTLLTQKLKDYSITETPYYKTLGKPLFRESKKARQASLFKVFGEAMLDEPGRDHSANQESCDISAINMLPSEQIQPAIPCEAFFQSPPAGKIDTTSPPREESVNSNVFQRQSESRFVPVSPRSPVCNPGSTCRVTQGEHRTIPVGRPGTDVVIIPQFERRKTESEKRKYDCSDDCSDSSDEEICQLLCHSSPQYCTIPSASCPMSTLTTNNNNNNNNTGGGSSSSSSRGSSRGSSRCCCPAEPDQVNLKQPQYPQSARAFHAVVPQKRFRPSSITVIQRPYLNFDKMQKNTFHRKHSQLEAGRTRNIRFKTIHRTL